MITNLLSDSQSSEFAYATNMTAIDVQQASTVIVAPVITVTTPASGAFTAATSDICTKTAHGMKTGLKVQVSNSGGALPAGLAALTDYWVIYLSANTFSLASSLANAIAGTAVDITDTGTGTHTVAPIAISGGKFLLQGSMDNSNFADVQELFAYVSETNNFGLKAENPGWKYIRARYELTSGQISVVQTSLVKGLI